MGGAAATDTLPASHHLTNLEVCQRSTWSIAYGPEESSPLRMKQRKRRQMAIGRNRDIAGGILLGEIQRQMRQADRYRRDNTRRAVEAKSWREFAEYCKQIETARDSIFEGMAYERAILSRLRAEKPSLNM